MGGMVPQYAVGKPAMQSPHECHHIGRECHGKIIGELSPEGIEVIIEEGVMPRFVLVCGDEFDAIIGQGCGVVSGGGIFE